MNITHFFYKLSAFIKRLVNKHDPWATRVFRVLLIVFMFLLLGITEQCRILDGQEANFPKGQNQLLPGKNISEGVSEALKRNKGYWDIYGYTNYNINMKVGIGKDKNSSVIVSDYDYNLYAETVADLQIQVVNGTIQEIKKLSSNDFEILDPKENIWFTSVDGLFSIIQDIRDGKDNTNIRTLVQTYWPSLVFVKNSPKPMVSYLENNHATTAGLDVWARFDGWGNPQIITVYCVEVDTGSYPKAFTLLTFFIELHLSH